ncbi:hypothetical protein [Streptomyces atratus]|nr:hypothetical protein [Streptomyces atratus]MCT2546257.1 hypothetical protein [Streptomyces atratus]
MTGFQQVAGMLLSLSSIAAALASPFAILAARRSVARIHTQSDQNQKEQ